MPWLALRVEVDGAAAEALSDALLAGGAQSVAIDKIEAARPSVSALIGLEADAAALLREACAACGIPAIAPFELARVDDDDWVRVSQAQFSPVTIGERLWVGPSWRKPPAGIAAVQLDPGLAFGTGSHATTRLCLEFLARKLRGGERVLDYGCGSGILAVAAAKLGAARADAVDLDPLALQATRANALANGVAVSAVAPEALAPSAYEIVVSNILAQPLILLAPLLAARAARRGCIALAGILEPQAAEVARAYAPWFDIKVGAVEDSWALLEGTRL